MTGERRPRVAERHTVAVDVLDPRHHEHVLEVGCGRGAAAELICARLRDGRYVGLDRSAAAVAAATQRLAARVERGTARFVTAALADAGLATGPFDAVLAIDVNLFWTGSPGRELVRLGELLRPAGRLVLVHQPPDDALLPRIRAGVTANLERSGWRPVVRTRSGTRSTLLTVTATRPGAVPRSPSPTGGQHRACSSS